MGWRTLTRDRQDATQEELCRILGVTEETFSHSVFAAQGARHFADAGLTAAERKAILAEAVGLGDYDRLLDLCRTDLRAAQALAYGLESRLQVFADQLRTVEGAAVRLADTREQLAAARLLVVENEGFRRALQAEHDRARAARAELAADTQLLAERRRALERMAEKLAAAASAREEAARLRPAREDLAEAALDLAPLREALEALREQQRRHDDQVTRLDRLNDQVANNRAACSRLSAEALTIIDSAQALRRQADQVENAPGAVFCDRCGEELATASRKTMVLNLRSEADTLSEQAAEKERQADFHEEQADRLAAEAALVEPCEKPSPHQVQAALQRIGDAQDAQVRLVSVTARLNVLDAMIDEVEADEFVREHAATVAVVQTTAARVDALAGTLPSEEQVQQLDRELMAAQLAVDESRGRVEELAGDVARAEQQAETQQRLEKGVVAAQLELDSTRMRLAVLQELERMYSRDGVPALILESSVIPTLEQHANEWLDAWGLPYRVELRTQVEQKTTSRLKDTLAVVVVDGMVERNYGTFSGGERARVNVSLQVALARLLAHRHGAPMEVFALDEVEFLDVAGQERLAELLHDLSKEIPVVLLVTHAETLRDRVDQTLLVVREGGVSRLEAA